MTGSKETSPNVRSPCQVSALHHQRSPWSTCASSSVGQDSDERNTALSDFSVTQSDPKLRVCMLGYNGTGKTSLVSQFLTSEYMNTYDNSLGNFWLTLNLACIFLSVDHYDFQENCLVTFWNILDHLPLPIIHIFALISHWLIKCL